MKNNIFDDLQPIIDISNEEIINNKYNQYDKLFEIIGLKTQFGIKNNYIYSEEDINLLKTIDEIDFIIDEIPDEIFFSSNINCIGFLAVFDPNSKSSVFIKSNVINPFSFYKGELHTCGVVINE